MLFFCIVIFICCFCFVTKARLVFDVTRMYVHEQLFCSIAD